MEIAISKKDILWGYIAQFFSIASGIIVLPFILRMLSPEEIGMNYLMLTIGTIVSLFDFGFSPQFSRNITYVFSGAQELKKDGITDTDAGAPVNYRLLTTMIATAKFVYRRLAIICLIVMLTLGTLYINHITNGFTNIKNSFFIWLVYSISVFFNMYYHYYSALLLGRGLIMESKKALVYSRVVYIVLVFVFLFGGLGLLGVAIANLVTPFVNRIISYFYFFTRDLKSKIRDFDITKKEKVALFHVIWHNARKLGLVFIGAYAITRLGLFLAGLFLSLSDIASYGLMLQLGGLVLTISSVFFSINMPKFASLRTINDTNRLFKELALTMNIYYILFIIGAICLIMLAPYILALVKSNTVLPTTNIFVLYLLVLFLEGNHSHFATIIVSGNNVPFVKPSLIAGIAIAIGSFLSLKYTTLGILGLIIVQGFCQLVYANWKWPHVVCKEFNKNFVSFLSIGFHETFYKIDRLVGCKERCDYK